MLRIISDALTSVDRVVNEEKLVSFGIDKTHFQLEIDNMFQGFRVRIVRRSCGKTGYIPARWRTRKPRRLRQVAHTIPSLRREADWPILA